MNLSEEIILSEAWLIITETAVTIAREPFMARPALDFLCAKTEITEP